MFLGTQSMEPQKYRNASAIYLFSGNGAVLMDCAEGTYGQMYDYFGSKERVDSALNKTRVIYITHLHGDHNLGLPSIMTERDKAQSKLPPN